MLTIHKASAGSGKTFALTRQYLKLLLGVKGHDGRYRLRPFDGRGRLSKKAHSEILAVTFTNKATQEMTERIISELTLLADGPATNDSDNSPHLDYFIKEFNTDADTLAKHARRALDDLLFNFSWFNVSTIDAFFQRVLNTFTRELEISPTHGVEIDENYAISVAVGKMLQSINMPEHSGATAADKTRRRHLEDWLLQFMKASFERGNMANMFSKSAKSHETLIKEIYSFYNEQYKVNREAIDAYFDDFERIIRFAAVISPHGDYVSGITDALARRSADILSLMGESGAVTVHSLIKNWSEGKIAVKSDNRTAPKLGADGSTAFRKNDPIPPGLPDAIKALATDVLAFNTELRLFNLLYTNIYQLGLFGQVNRYLDEYRRENDSLLLSDTGDLLKSIINEEEAPFIYERMGSAIRHYLIDEFQDTSQLQWENMQPLVLESMSENHDNLIIGDEKQCIYRFRNSDPELLGSTVEHTVGNRFPGNVEIKGIAVSENTNWRSSPEVVTFNNTVFAVLASLLDKTSTQSIVKTYNGLVQQVAPKHSDLSGYINIRFIPSLSTSDTEEPDDDSEADDANRLQLKMLTDEISRQLDAGFAPNDIAVLVRKGAQGSEVISHLMSVMDDPESGWHHGKIAIVSSDSIPVGMAHAVKMIVNILRITTEPEKIISPEADVDTGGDPTMTDNGIYQRSRLVHRFEIERFTTIEEPDGNGGTTTRRLTDTEALARAVAATSSQPGNPNYDEVQQRIDNELKKLNNIESPTLLDLTEHIIANFLPADAVNHDIAFITAFQDLVVEFSENGNNSVMDFLDWWDYRGKQTNVEASQDVKGINVMTIHKAKGLEFECVHVPYFSEKIVPEDIPSRRSLGWYKIDATAIGAAANAADVPPFMLLPNRLANKEIPSLRRQVEKWETEQTVDGLNVAYVAFTRAVRELCIYVDKMPATYSTSKKNSATPQWGDYLLEALKAASASQLNLRHLPDDKRQWMHPLDIGLKTDANGMLCYTAGQPVVLKQSIGDLFNIGTEAPKSDSATEPAGEHLDFTEIYRINGNARIFSEMELDDTRNFDFNDDRKRGTFLHNVLSMVRHRDDLPHALAGRAKRFRLTPEQTAFCLQMLENALNDERVKPWFSNFHRVIMEQAVTGPVTLRRPDRVVWTADGEIAVVDYKFGEINKEAYREQVRDYCTLLADAGYPGAKGYLWFPLKGEIIQVV